MPHLIGGEKEPRALCKQLFTSPKFVSLEFETKQTSWQKKAEVSLFTED